MKTIITTALLSASLLLAIPAQAAAVKTAGQAMSLCKNHAQETHEGYLRSKSKKIKQTRSGYTIKLKVISESGSELIQCSVAKDGGLDYMRDESNNNLATK